MGTSTVSYAVVGETFDTGLSGWTADGGSLAFVVDGGNPGGHLQLTDDATSDMAIIAPANEFFSGNLSGFYAATIYFDARLVGLSDLGTAYPTFGTVTIASGSTSLSKDFAPVGNEPPSEWTTYSGALTSFNWGVSTDELLNLLSNVTSISVTLESYAPVVETVAFDNFRIVPIPEPSTLCLAVVTSIVAFVGVRRRK